MLTDGQSRPAAIRRAATAAAASAALAGLAAGCVPHKAEIPAQAPPAPSAALAIPKGARVFDIDPQRSVVTIRVYRAGPLAKLGHNHVITSGEEFGVAWQGREPADSGFELHIPVATLVVDDAAARAPAGPDFAGTVPDTAREGTYQNMLRPEVLDGARFPQVLVQCRALRGTWDKPVTTAEVSLKGVTRRIDVPLEIHVSADSLEARGSFRILQSDFGITPFSVGGGAIQVADGVDLGFDIVATAR